MKSVFDAEESQALLQATINGELPDNRGRFGPFGGRYVPETLVPAFDRLEQGIVKGHKEIDDIDLSSRRTSVIGRDRNPQRIVLDRKQLRRYDESHRGLRTCGHDSRESDSARSLYQGRYPSEIRGLITDNAVPGPPVDRQVDVVCLAEPAVGLEFQICG